MERRGFLERAEREDAWIGNGSDEEPEVRLFPREKLGNIMGQRLDVVEPVFDRGALDIARVVSADDDVGRFGKARLRVGRVIERDGGRGRVGMVMQLNAHMLFHADGAVERCAH